MGAGGVVMLTARLIRTHTKRNAIGIQAGIADTAAAFLTPGAAVRACIGSSRINRVTVAVVSARLRGPNGILPMHWVRHSTAAALGRFVHFAASAQGSRPSRARTESIVRVEPFNSVPTSANRNGLRFEFFNANASVLITRISCSCDGSAGHYWPCEGRFVTWSARRLLEMDDRQPRTSKTMRTIR